METVVTPSPRFWRDKRVLVTGHTGFKGAWVSLWLERMGAAVLGFALDPPTDPSLFALSKLERTIQSTIGDIRDLKATTTAVTQARPQVIIHMAAQSLVRPSYEDPVGTFDTNVMGTVHVLEAARHCPSVRVIIVVTSDKCYENREWHWAYRETEAMGGYDPYSASKGCAELVTSAWRRSFLGGAEKPAALASARVGNVIGGGDWAQDRIITDSMRALMAGEAIPVRSPDAIRPWQHVLEPLSGYLILAERLWTDGPAYAEAWNFGPAEEDASPVSWIVSRLVELWGADAAWHMEDGGHRHEATNLRVDAAKARSRLGWRPRMNLSCCLEWTTEWYRRYQSGEDARLITVDQIERYQQMDANNP